MTPVTPHLSDQGLELIRRFEGFSATPYRCPGGYSTIGYGHRIRLGELLPAPLSQARARALLRADVAAAEAAVHRYVTVSLTPGQFDALVSFVFNAGAGAFARSRLRAAINRGDHAAVPEEMRRWVYASGRRLAGLARRREAEIARYQAA